MRLKYLVLVCCLTGIYSAQSQTGTSLAAFIYHQDSLLRDAYKQKDSVRYKNYFDDFMSHYEGLDAQGKKMYANHYINAYYNFACLHALLNKKHRALYYLEQSIKAGYYSYSHILQDSDLDCLRGEPAFKSMIEPLRSAGDYLYILRKGAAYNSGDTRPVPDFTYQSPDDPSLMALRNGFHLDSIQGNGSETSRVINLLHWVHDLIPHDGNHENPVVKNAMNMIAVCKRDNRGLNCRGLATVLNECYLALGYRSRIVTCLPKDSLRVDPDCHVINTVFLPGLKKWVWLDPTNDAYVMNEHGELLGIEEVRERVIKNKPVLLNPDANWNHRLSVTKENYLFNYMAKNLYLLQCPVRSEYDAETAATNKNIEYITLQPLDYFRQKPDKSVTHASSGTSYIYYRTNDPEKFWRQP